MLWFKNLDPQNGLFPWSFSNRGINIAKPCAPCSFPRRPCFVHPRFACGSPGPPQCVFVVRHVVAGPCEPLCWLWLLCFNDAFARLPRVFLPRTRLEKMRDWCKTNMIGLESNRIMPSRKHLRFPCKLVQACKQKRFGANTILTRPKFARKIRLVGFGHFPSL